MPRRVRTHADERPSQMSDSAHGDEQCGPQNRAGKRAIHSSCLKVRLLLATPAAHTVTLAAARQMEPEAPPISSME